MSWPDSDLSPTDHSHDGQGRLPVGIVAIDEALEAGFSQCLRNLQRSSPSLLLTSSQLRTVERDVRHIPAMATALSSIAACSPQMTEMVHSWRKSDDASDLSALIEDKLRVVLEKATKPQRKKKRRADDSDNDDEETGLDLLHADRKAVVTPVNDPCDSEEEYREWDE